MSIDLQATDDAGKGTRAAVFARFAKERGLPKTPEDFGAVGDGVTNDTTAFQLLAAYVMEQGGCHVAFPNKTYVVGRQTFAGETGKGYAYLNEEIFTVQNCTKPIVVHSDGAVFKIADGLKYGSFDPVTGAVHNPVQPFWNADYAASVGMVLHFLNNSGGVSIKGAIEIDGNVSNLHIGGGWGDVGIQTGAYGIRQRGNASFYAENVYSHHHALDGMSVGWPGSVDRGPKKPTTLVNCTFDHNGRQGVSWVGGIGFTAINCKFNNTGRAVNTGTGAVVASNPGSGLDIEAESAVCRNGVFINCDFINNFGTAMVASTGDSADVHFFGCRFGGTVWPNKPGYRFTDCRFHGKLLNVYGHADTSKAAQFTSCTFTDDAIDNFEPSVEFGSVMFGSTGTLPVYFSRCTFNATRQRPGRFDCFVLDDCNVNLTFNGTNAVENKGYVIQLNGAVLRNFSVTSNITTNAPADGYYIETSALARTQGYNFLTNTAGIVRWGSWSVGSGGHIGRLGVSGTQDMERRGFKSYNPASLTNGAFESTTLTVPATQYADVVTASYSVDLQGVTLTAAITGANTVTVTFTNNTGGTVDVGSGSIAVVVKTL